MKFVKDWEQVGIGAAISVAVLVSLWVSFTLGSISESQLNRVKKIVCPECGHLFYQERNSGE